MFRSTQTSRPCRPRLGSSLAGLSCLIRSRWTRSMERRCVGRPSSHRRSNAPGKKLRTATACCSQRCRARSTVGSPSLAVPLPAHMHGLTRSALTSAALWREVAFREPSPYGGYERSAMARAPLTGDSISTCSAALTPCVLKSVLFNGHFLNFSRKCVA